MTTPGADGVYRRRIPEIPVPGKPLGRHVEHDPRSWAYRHQQTATAIKTVLWDRVVPVWNQGDTSSCTGQAETGALGTAPLYASLAAARITVTLNEAEALRLYSAAEVIDGDGPYPPNDNGSSGLSVCKAAKNAGLISGYTHLMSVADVKDALQAGPCILGTNWYSSMDTPTGNGVVVITPGAYVRGGHEYECVGYSTQADLFEMVNSWGLTWGLRGRFFYSTATLTRLLAEEGDGTVSIPITSPAPKPIPAAM